MSLDNFVNNCIKNIFQATTKKSDKNVWFFPSFVAGEFKFESK